MSTLEHNLSALPAAVSELVMSTGPHPRAIAEPARDGTPNLGLVGREGTRMFHSRYAPRTEARRLADSVTADVVVVAGAGLGYHLTHLLAAEKRVLLFEPSPALLRRFLEAVPVHTHLQSGSLLIVLESQRFSETFLQWYIPILHGDLSTLSLPGRVAAEPELFEDLSRRLDAAQRQLQSDIGTQARFGLVWMRNVLRNLASCATKQIPIVSGKLLRSADAVVAGAGPSLDAHLPWIREHRSMVRLLATDTALPACLSAGVHPDLVVAIDANPISAHHYLAAGLYTMTIAAELSSPPAVIERAHGLIPLASGNPLHQAFIRHGVPMETAHTTTGSATTVAALFAADHGCRSVTLAGADFSYVNKRTYARHTYVDRYFDVAANRTNPSTTQQLRFLYDRPGIAPLHDSDHILITPALDDYRSRMCEALQSSATPVYALAGTGARLPFDEPPVPHSPRPPIRSTSTIQRASVRGACDALVESLSLLDDSTSIREAITGYGPDDRIYAARSLVPMAYAILAGGKTRNANRALLEARSILSRRLQQTAESLR